MVKVESPTDAEQNFIVLCNITAQYTWLSLSSIKDISEAWELFRALGNSKTEKRDYKRYSGLVSHLCECIIGIDVIYSLMVLPVLAHK